MSTLAPPAARLNTALITRIRRHIAAIEATLPRLRDDGGPLDDTYLYRRGLSSAMETCRLQLLRMPPEAVADAALATSQCQIGLLLPAGRGFGDGERRIVAIITDYLDRGAA